MSLQKDPERNESKHLQKFADFANRRVLEIGSGEGRLTWQYAKLTRTTVGMDLDRDALRVARVDRPFDLDQNIHFVCAASEYLPFSKETFDIAVLAWSL
ncbi:MAG TPA: class I SAM-dependent methyltransferase [Anaerolineales bacterium]|nr:class I SAM-dependent methyltransferase [Anaerolineales bacterium]